MSTIIQQANRNDISELIYCLGGDTFSLEQMDFFQRCVRLSSGLWVGFKDGKLICLWGLIPPSLLSDKAYLWLYNTDDVAGCEFVFIRQSQIAVKAMLEKYPEIYGHAVIGNTKGIRWLKWLGASFMEPIGQFIPFVIRREVRG